MKQTIYIIMFLALAACSSSSPSEPEVTRTVLTKGDPLQFVASATTNSKQGLPAELFANDRPWSVKMEVFETSEREPPSSDQSERAKKIRRDSLVNGRHLILPHPYFQDSANGGKVYGAASPTEVLFIVEFVERNGAYFLREEHTAAGISTQQSDYKVLHYSYKEDGSMFSVLTYGTLANSKKTLIAYTFVSQDLNKSVEKTFISRAYEYIARNYGLAGARLGWPMGAKQEFTICHPAKTHKPPGASKAVATSPQVRQALVNSALDGLEVWNKVLQPEGRFEFVPNVMESCPPFSDVNYNMLSFVDKYVHITGPESKNGVASHTNDMPVTQFLKGNIFIFLGDIEESARVYSPNFNIYDIKNFSPADTYHIEYITRTTTHEIGHHLGLDHKFDGTASVMSYDSAPRERPWVTSKSGFARLYSYDIDAIKELYPVVQPEGKPISEKPVDEEQTVEE